MTASGWLPAFAYTVGIEGIIAACLGLRTGPCIVAVLGINLITHPAAFLAVTSGTASDLGALEIGIAAGEAVLLRVALPHLSWMESVVVAGSMNSASFFSGILLFWR